MALGRGGRAAIPKQAGQEQRGSERPWPTTSGDPAHLPQPPGVICLRDSAAIQAKCCGEMIGAGSGAGGFDVGRGDAGGRNGGGICAWRPPGEARPPYGGMGQVHKHSACGGAGGPHAAQEGLGTPRGVRHRGWSPGVERPRVKSPT
jgi:hypothetical protein